MTLKRIRRIIVPLMLSALAVASADTVVLLHTNDTHSAIDPDAKGAGGVLQRKAIIDSVRNVQKNVVLIDAGDVVQGTLYFSFFGGDVEYPLMNMMGYDIRTLGNHEFDNGFESLARYYKDVKAARLSANYDFSATPLHGMFSPYVIKKIGGKKIGFIGINVNPDKLISKANYPGLVYKDAVKTANETAHFLKADKKCDLVVVVSHIGIVEENGKPTDYDIARTSHDIDIIIGGHSHSVILPGNAGKDPSVVKNADGRNVLVAQTGRGGKYIGEITIDTDRIKSGADAAEYKLIPVTDRFPADRLDARMTEFLKPFRHVVDSVNSRVIAKSLYDLDSDDFNGGYANWAADFARWYGVQKLDSLGIGHCRPVIGIMNVGGIRHDMPKGDVTEGQMLSTFPFANNMVLTEVKGSDLIDAMKSVAASPAGAEGVSANVRVVTDGKGGFVRMVLDGNEIDPSQTYIVSTISYIVEGNDGFDAIARGKVIWTDSNVMAVPIMRYINHLTQLGLPIAPDPTGRFQKQVTIP